MLYGVVDGFLGDVVEMGGQGIVPDGYVPWTVEGAQDVEDARGARRGRSTPAWS